MNAKNKDYSILTYAFMLAIFLSLFGVGSGDKALADGSSNLVRQLTWILFGGLSFFECFRIRRGLELNIQFTSGFFWSVALFFYCLASCYWSAIPFVTLKRAVLFGLVVFFCFATFSKHGNNPRSFLFSLAVPVAVLILLSFLLIVIVPSVGVTSLGWRGVTSFKNEFGQLCAIGFLVFLFGFAEFKRKLLVVFLWLLSIVGLVMSQSTTCAVAVFIGSFAGVTLFFIRKSTISKYGSAMLLLLILSVVSLLLVLLTVKGNFFDDIQGKIFSLLGKSSTLTGRTKLWVLVMDNVRFHNKWLGGGYGGFWDGLGSPANFTSYRFPGGYVGQAHNGYIDIFNDLGYVGIVFLISILLVYFVAIAKQFAAGAPEFYFHFSFFIFILIENYAESTFFRLVVFLNIVFFASLARVFAVAAKNKYGQ